MVESTESRERDNISVLSGFNHAPSGRITVERHVGPVVVVVPHVFAETSQQVKLIEHDEVVDELATKGSDEPLDVTVLPRGARRRPDLR